MSEQDYTKIESHYGNDYFSNYQKAVGEFGGTANLFKFRDSIKSSDTVLDFGCGGGFLLKNINCANKIGIELNPVARKYCNEVNKVPCYESLSEVADGSIDVVITNHCLEHVPSPFEIIAELYRKIKPGGKIVIVVPLDSYRYKWKPNDVNNHLYSFSPMNLGNLLQGTGFQDIRTRPVLHKWPPFYRKIASIFGHKIFDMIAWFYGTVINKRWVQTKGEGVKK